MKTKPRINQTPPRWQLLPVLSVLFPLLLSAQHFYPPEPLPATYKELSSYQQLTEEKKRYQEQIDGLLKRGEEELSANEFFYLSLGISPLPERTAPMLAGQVETYGPKFRELMNRLIAADALLALEQQFITINTRLAALENIYRPPIELLEAYPVEDSPERREEIEAYQLLPGQTIVEVGAGHERFAASLNHFHHGLTVYVNDVDTGAVLRLAYHFQYNPAFQRRGNQFSAILGTPLEVGLGPVKADRVIIRNALHHFDNPESMLLSISESLKPAGIVYLYERFAESCGDNCCSHLLSQAQLLDLFQNNGFRLYREFHTSEGNRWILGFSKAEG